MATDAPTPTKRRHTTGESTRLLLMETAERLFALRGIEGVSLREIQLEAGQSNSSVITYHFGSRDGLVQALVRHRHGGLDERRAAVLEQMRADDAAGDLRAMVWLVVRPLIASIRAGEMYVPFLARLSENTRASTAYWPADVQPWGVAGVEEVLDAALADLPPRIRRGRTFQLYNSVLNLLGEEARSGRTISEAQLNNYVDGWVGMLTAPISEQTRALL